ncbi:MAG: glucosaminidase domain-containing protein [Bacilli bacterium]|nr:glucosaminidase domain-containing protein [Bacilli bacterium]MBO6195544.1 glucosaminidase domain-containing protein [Bacilli bacterium]
MINNKVITVFIVSMVTIISFSLFLSNIDKNKLQASINNKKEEPKEILDLVQDRTKDQALTRRVIVYDNMTMSELSAKLNRSMKDTIAGKGELLASYSLEKGVDPYVALSIILLESGCNSGRCSGLTRNCYNVGGQKGSPGCNGGSYKAFSNIDEGIKSFVDNLATYYARGLNTPEKMNSRYAESQVWAQKVRSYMSSISRK